MAEIKQHPATQAAIETIELLVTMVCDEDDHFRRQAARDLGKRIILRHAERLTEKSPAPNIDAISSLSDATKNACEALAAAAEAVMKVGKSNG